MFGAAWWHILEAAAGGGAKKGHGHTVAAGRRMVRIQAMMEEMRRQEATSGRFRRLADEVGVERANELIYHRLRVEAEESFQKAMNVRSSYTILIAEM